MDETARLAPLLRSGEHLVWTGHPDPRVLFAPGDAFLVPFSILWGGFAVFWEASAIASGAPLFFWLWGIPFVLVGSYVVVGRFVYKRHAKARTVYGLTETRAIVSARPGAYSDVSLDKTSVSVRRSRGGDHVSVEFGDGPGWPHRMPANTGMDLFTGGRATFGFYDVADPALESTLHRVRT